jgi:hypothetical protein
VAEFPMIISVDDHVVEPPRLWQDRLLRGNAIRMLELDRT